MVQIAAPALAVVSPPLSMLPRHKVDADPDALAQWVEAHATEAHALVASIEMLVYGGLIASRVSNDTGATVQSRVLWLASLPRRFPTLRLYLSSVVMRIPTYNGDFEEPWYWADHGHDLFLYSFYTSRFRKLHDPADQQRAEAAAATVPLNALHEFTWRRQRNLNVSRQLLTSPLVHARALYVTLDDGAEYGLNVDEATELEALARARNLSADDVKFYQGADEVGAVLMSRLAVDDAHDGGRPLARAQGVDGASIGFQQQIARPAARLVWRAPNASGLVPAYESRSVATTVASQLAAAGLRVLHPNSSEPAHVLMLISNFAVGPQLEASQQAISPPSDYERLTDALDAAPPEAVVAVADVRYANGADRSLVGLLEQSTALRGRHGAFAYAGWNTNGNSLGTVAANAALLALFPCEELAAARFTQYRLLEDFGYQASARTALSAYVQTTADEGLAADLPFYERFAFKPLSKLGAQLRAAFGLPDAAGHLEGISYPWNRTFEIALQLSNLSADGAWPEVKPDAARCGVLLDAPRVPRGGEEAAHGAPPAEARLPVTDSAVACDVLIVGGSTAALAAALTAADANGSLVTCLTEPTDWVGGQVSSSLLTAIDFGKANRVPAALPASFVHLLRALGWPSANPGACWVSTACFHVADGRAWIEAALARRRGTLRVLPLTVPSGLEVDDASGRVLSATLVERRPKVGVRLNGFDERYSSQVGDWYDTRPSPRFDKRVVRVVPRGATFSVIDATELGDVLMLRSGRVLQGTEADEAAPEAAHNDRCGQAIAFASYLQEEAPQQAPPLEQRTLGGERPQHVPSSEEAPLSEEPPWSEHGAGPLQGHGYSLDNHSWASVWSYRRVATAPDTPVSLQAWGGVSGDGNDWPYSYHLLPLHMAFAQRPWQGGINTSALAAAEAYSLGWARWFASRMPAGAGAAAPSLQTGLAGSGTASGLAKLPYVRDTRRSVGVGGFVLTSGHMSAPIRFADRIALGDYLYFDVHGLQGCKPPSFAGPLRPYYVPLRALTHADTPNLFVAGKTMAQTQAANAGTRLHPVEWATGVAAGVAAAHAVARGVSASHLVKECTRSTETYCGLQRALRAFAPLEW